MANRTLLSYVGAVLYPRGSYYFSTSSVNPANIWGGTWVKVTNTFLCGNNSNWTGSGSTSTPLVEHTHTISHSHTLGTAASHTHKMDMSDYCLTKSTSSYHYYSYSTYTEKKATSPYTHSHAFVADSTAPITGNTGIDNSGTAVTSSIPSDSNMPPYQAVNIWKRTAL